MEEDRKVFIRGRVSGEDEKDSKMICEKIWSFEDIPRELWVQFPSMEDYKNQEDALFGFIREEEGQGPGGDLCKVAQVN